jgi:hypothetical protein
MYLKKKIIEQIFIKNCKIQISKMIRNMVYLEYFIRWTSLWIT